MVLLIESTNAYNLAYASKKKKEQFYEHGSVRLFINLFRFKKKESYSDTFIEYFIFTISLLFIDIDQCIFSMPLHWHKKKKET